MAEDPLDTLKAELQRRVGRNLMRYQSIEQLMKFLLAHTRVTITAEGPTPEFERRREALLKQTMGQLRDNYFRELLCDVGVDEQAAPPADRPSVTTTFRLELSSGAGDLTSQQAAFASMLEDRNNLVHHFLSMQDLGTAEGLQQAIDHLDRQREKAIPLHDHLRSLIDALQAGRKEIAEFLASDEGVRQIELQLLQQSRLVSVLFQASQAIGTADGWLPLATAGHVLSREAADELRSMRSRYGHRTLRQLVLAAELFEVDDELLPSGGFRTRYRIRPELLRMALN